MAPNSCSSEEFSFPALVSQDSLSSGLDSPPLWKLSPSATPSHRDDDDGDSFFARKPSKSDQIRKSFSSVDVKNFCDSHKEDKMDMLWEDLNDDLPRSRSLKIDSSDAVTSSSNNNNKTSPYSEDGMAVSVGCGVGRSLNVAKLPEKKKPNMLVFMKILKKLLLLRNSSRHHRSPVKTHPP